MHYFAISYSGKKRQWMSEKCGCMAMCRADQVLLPHSKRELLAAAVLIICFLAVLPSTCVQLAGKLFITE